MVVLERPKMSRPMWDALKCHIMRERQKKKQELEADAEVERQRKEREQQEKQDSMTLSETKEQISSLDTKLTELKEEKHQLFLQLKKVLNEDETRRRQLLNKEANEMLAMQSYMAPQGVQFSQGPPGTSQMFLQPLTLTRSPMYKVGPVQTHHTLLQTGALKRGQSPSPPPQHQAHNYKFGPFKPPPQAMHSYPPKPMGIQYYPPPISQSTQHISTTYSSGPIGQSGQSSIYNYSGSSSSSSRSPQITREEQPKSNLPPRMYLHPTQSIPRGFHIPPQKFESESPKYYPPPPLPLRTSHSLSLHPSLTIQPSQGTSGGITSGYPIRTTPASSYQGRPPSPHGSYAGSTAGPPRLSFSHSHGHQVVPPPHSSVTVQRYTLPPGI